jgi:hypothetical protein
MIGLVDFSMHIKLLLGESISMRCDEGCTRYGAFVATVEGGVDLELEWNEGGRARILPRLAPGAAYRKLRRKRRVKQEQTRGRAALQARRAVTQG